MNLISMIRIICIEYLEVVIVNSSVFGSSFRT